MALRFSVFLTLLLFFSEITFSAGSGSESGDSLKDNSYNPTAFELVKYDFNKSFEDGLNILEAPAHFSGWDWGVAGMIAGATSLSFLLDNDIRDIVRRNQSGTIDDITKAGQYYGEVVPAVSLSAGIYATGLIFKDRWLSFTGRLLGESLLYAGTLNIILKVLFSRARPYKNQGNTDFGNYKFDNDYYSLPSGHTTVAFTVSTILAERIHNVYASIGLYGLAALTAYQRIYSDNHWFSDTLLGAAIGMVISRAVLNLNQSDPYEESNPDISVSPTRQGYAVGFRLTF